MDESDKYNPLGLALYAACPEARMKGVSTGSRFSAGRRNIDLLLRWTSVPDRASPRLLVPDFAFVGVRDVCFFPPSLRVLFFLFCLWFWRNYCGWSVVVQVALTRYFPGVSHAVPFSGRLVADGPPLALTSVALPGR